MSRSVLMSRQVVIDGIAGEKSQHTQQAQNGISWHVQAAQPDRDESGGAKFPTVLRKKVTLTFASWNQMSSWLSQLQGLQRAA